MVYRESVMKVPGVLRLLVFLLALSLNLGASGQEADPVGPGQPMPPWTPGTLDLHHLSTGRGNATFGRLPDGTTILIDAGDTRDQLPFEAPMPAGVTSASDWIVRYIRTALGVDAELVLDYAVITHFHSDHMGFVRDDTPRVDPGGYALVGIAAVGHAMPIRTLIDRGWPDYDTPQPITHAGMESYRHFLNWQRERHGLEVARLAVGRDDQIVLRHEPETYPTFRVRNLAANGEVWTGVGMSTRQQFPSFERLASRDVPSENMHSVALRIRYGRFDYVTTGDLPGVPEEGAPSFHDLETPIAEAIGPTDVQVVGHHG